jgi:hypothetical protein
VKAKQPDITLIGDLFMSYNLIKTLLLSLSALACGTHQNSSLSSQSDTETSEESPFVVGYRINPKTLTFIISTDDCAKDADFDIFWLESFPGQALLTHSSKTPCSGKKVQRELSFPSTGGFFTIANPVRVERKSFQCQYQDISKTSKLFSRKSGAWDVPLKDESLTLKITVEGCTQGTKLSLGKWTGTVAGQTGKLTHDIRSQDICVKEFGRQGALLPGKDGPMAIRITEIENGVVKSAGVAANVSQAGSMEMKDLDCSSL